MTHNGSITLEEFGRKLAKIPGMSDLIEEESANLRAAQFIRQSRKIAGLSQDKLAKQINVTQARVSQMENGEGRYGVSLALLARVAKACGGTLRLSFEK
jgi:DNA-binding XRE family transcriptional regulator